MKQQSKNTTAFLRSVTAGFLLLFLLFGIACSAPETPPADPIEESETLALTEPIPAPEPKAMLEAGENGFPPMGYRHPLGEDYVFAGKVKSTVPLKSLRVRIYSVYNADPAIYPADAVVYLHGENSMDADLSELTPLVDFSSFAPGVHILQLYAIGEDGMSLPITAVKFYVVGEVWEQLSSDVFFDSYPETMAFFKEDTEKFLFRYQWVQGRYVMADPDWEEAYITYRDAYPQGSRWSMHTDAVPNFERAIGFLENTYVRVSGTNGDSGILPLCALIKSYNGCYVPRFTSSKQYISHHSFGTAIDLNAGMQSNLNTLENKALIDDEVRDHLSYEGIFEDDGVKFYHFTYSGDYAEKFRDVPESVINYLLYELAFYRSGFTWAHYYAATSDGMHFALTEYVTGDHDGEQGLRKVFTYISDTQ